jgi:HK97 family phage major capsid protein
MQTKVAEMMLAAIALQPVPFGAMMLGSIRMDGPRTTIESLRAKQQALVDANQAIVDGAGDNEISDDQLAAIEANRLDAENIGRQIAARESVAQPGAGTGRRTVPDALAQAAGGAGAGGGTGGGRVVVPAAARTDPRTAGFRHLGEFALCVRDAASRDEGAMGRLTAAVGMNEGVGEDGGFLVPTEFRESIMRTVEGEDSLLSRCDTSTTARNSVTQVIDESTPWGTAGIAVYWEGEGQAAPASSPKLGQTSIRLNKLFARVDVTDELLEDAPQLDNFLRVKTPEVMNNVINLAIIAGNGVGKPLGFMKSNALVTVSKESSQPTDTVHHRNIVKMWSRLYAPARANAVWLINQDVEPQFNLMSFRDGTTTPVPAYLPPNGLSASPYSTLMGRPVIPVQGMETLGDLGDIALVDLSKYRAVTKAGGARVDTSIHLKFDTDETVYRFIFRLAGAPWWSAPITPRDGPNTLSPFVTLETR